MTCDATRELHQRLDEIADRADLFLTREIRGILNEHPEDCDLCAKGYRHKDLVVIERLLRVKPLRNATETVQELAAEAVQRGAPVLTVLRRPELDTVETSITCPPQHPDVELFGFELVFPGRVVPVRLPGLPVAEFRVVDFTGSGKERPLVGLFNSRFGFSGAVNHLANEARRIAEFERERDRPVQS